MQARFYSLKLDKAGPRNRPVHVPYDTLRRRHLAQTPRHVPRRSRDSPAIAYERHHTRHSHSRRSLRTVRSASTATLQSATSRRLCPARPTTEPAIKAPHNGAQDARLDYLVPTRWGNLTPASLSVCPQTNRGQPDQRQRSRGLLCMISNPPREWRQQPLPKLIGRTRPRSPTR